jgi:hypothetical protein
MPAIVYAEPTINLEYKRGDYGERRLQAIESLAECMMVCVDVARRSTARDLDEKSNALEKSIHQKRFGEA